MDLLRFSGWLPWKAGNKKVGRMNIVLPIQGVINNGAKYQNKHFDVFLKSWKLKLDIFRNKKTLIFFLFYIYFRVVKFHMGEYVRSLI